MKSLGVLMGEKMELEQKLHEINKEIKNQESEKYKYLVGKCFKLGNIRYKILNVNDVRYHGQDRIDVCYTALKIGNRTITTDLQENLLIVIENNEISSEEFNNKFNNMVDYIKNNILCK